MERVAAEDETRRLTQVRFDAAVKVIKSLPPDGEPPCNTHPSLIESRPSQKLCPTGKPSRCQVQQSGGGSACLGSCKLYEA